MVNNKKNDIVSKETCSQGRYVDKSISILLVEDSDDDALLLVTHIQNAGYKPTVERVQNAADFVTALKKQGWDVIISDHALPAFSSTDALDLLNQAKLDIPFIIVSGELPEETAAQAMQKGADDFFPKNNLKRLVPAIEREMNDAQERYRRRFLEAERKNTRTAFAQSESRLKALFEHAQDAIFLVNNKMEYVDANPSACALLGVHKTHIIGKKIGSNLSEKAKAALPGQWETLLREGKYKSEYSIFLPDGQELILEYRAVANIAPNLHLMVANDITERRKQEQELRRTSVLLEKTFACLNDVVLVIEKSTRHVLMCNAATETTFGYKPAEIVGQDLSKLFMNESSYAALREMAFPSLDQGENFQAEYSMKRRDGSFIITEIMITPAAVLGNDSEGVVFVIKDITAKKQIEAAEFDHRLFTEALHDSANIISSTLELKEVIRLMLETVGRVVPHESANLMMVEGNQARLEYMQGYSPEIQAYFSEYRYPLDLPNLHTMLVTGKPYLVADSTKDPQWRAMEGMEWLKSYVGAPIRRQGQVIGFINLDSSIPGFFTSLHMERLQAFADQAAIAIENAQIYNALSDFATEMATLNRATAYLFEHFSSSQGLEALGKQIVEAVVRAFGQVDCGIMLVDSANNQALRLARAGDYQVQATQPLYLNGNGLVAEAVRRQEVVYAPDVSQDTRYIPSDSRTRSEMVIPLRINERIIGVLDLQSTEYDGFSANDQRILKAFAARAATAIENALLYSEIQTYANVLEQRVMERTTQFEQALENVETILNSSSDGIVLTYVDGTIRQSNPAFDELFLYEIDDAYGRSLADLVIPTQAADIRYTIKQLVNSHKTLRLEVTAVRKDNTTFEAEAAFSVMQDRRTGATGIVCTFHNITSHKKTQEYLMQSLEHQRELNQLKDRFVSMVSHEFRTPLATIQVTSDSLENYLDKLDGQQRAKRFEKIRTQIQHMTQLLENALNISRGESGRLNLNPTRLELVKFFTSVIEEVQTTINKPNPIEFTHHVICPVFMVDEWLMRQLLTNLLTNAIKYSPGGQAVQIDLHCEADLMTFHIKDNGIGIPEKDKKHLFEAFHRARNVGTISGTGLGLAITKHAVDLHNGTINFESEDGKGTTFTVTIPSAKDKEQKQ